ncbi:MAG: MotA/TolQ/ExbB proton channel family protein [Bacteriovoracales bacterium]
MEGVSQIIAEYSAIIRNGGFFAYVILLIWASGIAIAVERFFALFRKYDVDGASFMNEIQRYVLSNDLQGAIRICSGTTAALPRVLKAGLKRAKQNEKQIQNGLDAAAFEMIPKVESKLNYMGLLAAISTLAGLIGTIHGLMGAFAGVGSADPAQRAELLSKGMSEVMGTTFLGLCSAITIMVLHTFLSTKAGKITAEIDEYSIKLLDLLVTKEGSTED